MDSLKAANNSNGSTVAMNGTSNGKTNHFAATNNSSIGMPPDQPSRRARSGNFLKNLFSINGIRKQLTHSANNNINNNNGNLAAVDSSNIDDQTATNTSSAKGRRSKSSSANRQQSGTVQIRTVEIIKRPGQNLGFYLRDGNGIDRVGGVFVSRIADHSPLARNNLIKTGDEILAVNSMPTSSMKIEDCVYIISLSSKLLITVRSVPFDPRLATASSALGSKNGQEFNATPNSIVINHHHNNRQRELAAAAAALNNGNDNTDAKNSSSSGIVSSNEKEQTDNNKPSPISNENGNGKNGDLMVEQSEEMNKQAPRAMSDTDSAMSSSDENVHLTTLQKMESQFATLPKKISPSTTTFTPISKCQQRTDEQNTPPPPPPPPFVPPLPLPTNNNQNYEQTSQRGMPLFFNQRPQRFRSVEEFVMSGTETGEAAIAGDYSEPPRRLLIPSRRSGTAISDYLSGSGDCSTNSCTCGHRQRGGQIPRGNNYDQFPSATPNYRGLVRPTAVGANLSCTNLLNDVETTTGGGGNPLVGTNCYTCIRFGAGNCPHHFTLVQRGQQQCRGYQQHQQPRVIYFNGNSSNSNPNNNYNSGYTSDCGESRVSSYQQARNPTNSSAAACHRGRHQHFMTPCSHQQQIGYASSSGNIYSNVGDNNDTDDGTETDQDQSPWYYKNSYTQQSPYLQQQNCQHQQNLHPAHHNSASALPTIRRPSCLDVNGGGGGGSGGSGNYTDDDERQVEDLEIKTKRNHRLQLLLMQQHQDQLANNGGDKRAAGGSTTVTNFSTANRMSSEAFPTFFDYRKVQSFVSPDHHHPAQEPLSGQLNLNLQAFYLSSDAVNSNNEAADKAHELNGENGGSETKHLSATLNSDGNSLLSSLYCSVFVDGRPVGKTAARIGLKSFYFNEVFVVNVNANRYVTFIVYNYFGTAKPPQQRASALCPLAQLCRKDNTMKVAIPTYPSGVIFLRWLLKERPPQSPSSSALLTTVNNQQNQNQNQQPSAVRNNNEPNSVENTQTNDQQITANNSSNCSPPNNNNNFPPPPQFYEMNTNNNRGTVSSTSNGNMLVVPGSNSAIPVSDDFAGDSKLVIRGGAIATKSMTLSRKVFGIPLGDLVEAEWKLGLLSCHVPILIQLCIRILNTCANVEGLYSRMSPSDERQYLRECFEQTLEPKHLPLLCEKLMKFDCRVVSDLLLDFFEDMPEPLFPCQIAEDIASHFKASSDMSYIDRQMVVRQFLLECTPKHVAETFQTLIDHIFLLSVNASANKLSLNKLDSLFSSHIFSFGTGTTQRTANSSSSNNMIMTTSLIGDNNSNGSTTSGGNNQQAVDVSINNGNPNEQSSILLSPSTTTSASSVSSAASSLSSPPHQTSIFVQMCEIMFPMPNNAK